jgi:multimeric flavodoxin WrbA
MKILILNGSPNLNKGNTGSMLTALEKGLQIENPEIITKNVYQLKLKPCQGCVSCWTQTPGKCIQKDDMENVLPLIAESDILILATPVYVDGMTGRLKTLIERMLPLVKGRVELRNDHMRHLPRDPKKQGKIVLVSPSGFTERDNHAPLVSHVKGIAKHLGYSYVGEILAPGFRWGYNEENQRKALEIISDAGEELVKNGSISSNVSEMLSELASREKAVETLNKIFEKYE